MKLVDYLTSNLTKFDIFLKKNTDHEDTEEYLQSITSRSVDPVIEAVCLAIAYKRNLKILYNIGDWLKEKSIPYLAKSSCEDGTGKGNSDCSDEDSLFLFWIGNKFIPLLSDEDGSDECSSEESIEVSPK